ncbi:YcbK family protein [Salinarimonas sp.]|uniref:YcbK family protein n=1 Tax=Salinarimonas sp. TaxID=2766526 RepID=UPI00391D082F
MLLRIAPAIPLALSFVFIVPPPAAAQNDDRYAIFRADAEAEEAQAGSVTAEEPREPSPAAAAPAAAPAPAAASAPAPAAAEAAPPPIPGDVDQRFALMRDAAELDVETTGSIGAAAAAPTLTGFRAKVDAGTIWVRDSAPTRCLPGDLRGGVAEIATHFGEVRIMSTHRSPGHNRRAGGARRSLHLECRAIDFRVASRAGEVMAFLRDHPAVGGLKRYRNGIIHIDNGEPRRW